MAITFKTFSQCVPHVCAIKKPVLLRSRHGVGKSSVVYAYAKHIGLPVVERRASQMTEGDLLGLPKIDEDCTKYLPPEWFKIACDTAVVLFIDEIDRATPEVRQGFFELTDSRKLSGFHLHPDTQIFAAVNGGADCAAQYQVGEMDPAELDRWTTFDIEPDVEDWLTWAQRDDNIHPLVIDFIRQFPVHLEHMSDFEPNKVYPSRRSWHRLSDCLSTANLIQPGERSSVMFNLTTAFCGQEAGFAFGDFIKSCQKQMTAEDIINKGKVDGTKDYDINEHTALVEKILANKITDDVMTKKQIDNLVKYFLVLPSEVAMKLWTLLGAKNTDNLMAFHQNQKVVDHILVLVAGEQDKKENETK